MRDRNIVEKRDRVNRGMSRFVTGSGIAVLALLAIPAMLLFGAIWMVWTLTNRLAARFSRKGGK